MRGPRGLLQLPLFVKRINEEEAEDEKSSNDGGFVHCDGCDCVGQSEVE